MSAKYENLTSTSQLSTLTNKNTVVVIDFHATWCGPCKVIAPVFESLASRHASPGKVAFAKCDVDACQEVASQYSVRAMPTFVIIKNRSEVDRVQGADRASLTAAVERQVRDIKPAAGFATSGKGYTLGSTPKVPPPRTAAASGSGRTYMRNGEVTSGPPLRVQVEQFGGTIVRFAALYLGSLFSIDPIPTAAQSYFATQQAQRGSSVAGPPPPPVGIRLGRGNWQ